MAQVVPSEVLNFGALAGVAEDAQKASPVHGKWPVRWIQLAWWFGQGIQYFNGF